MVFTGPGYEIHSIGELELWSKIPDDGTVVNVGGSHGETAIALSEKFSAMKFVVQDPQSTINAHPQIPDNLANRVQCMAHDFLMPQPIKNADVYFFRWIFHTWPNRYCLKILKSFVPASKE